MELSRRRRLGAAKAVEPRPEAAAIEPRPICREPAAHEIVPIGTRAEEGGPDLRRCKRGS